jgi:hypothetical protein
LFKKELELIDQPICSLLSSHGKTKPGRKPMTYPEYIGKLINNDTPPSVDEKRKAAQSRTE